MNHDKMYLPLYGPSLDRVFVQTMIGFMKFVDIGMKDPRTAIQLGDVLYIDGQEYVVTSFDLDAKSVEIERVQHPPVGMRPPTMIDDANTDYDFDSAARRMRNYSIDTEEEKNNGSGTEE